MGFPGLELSGLQAGDVADGVARVDERELGEAEHDAGVGRLELAPLAAEGVGVDRDRLAPAQRLPEVHLEIEDAAGMGADPVGALDPQAQGAARRARPASSSGGAAR